MRPRLIVARGSTRCEMRSVRKSSGPAYDAPAVSIPEVGNQPRPAAKMMIMGIPITKYGIEYRMRLSPLPTRSVLPPRRQPVYAPRVRPPRIAITSAIPIRRIVGQNRSPITLTTGWPWNFME